MKLLGKIWAHIKNLISAYKFGYIEPHWYLDGNTLDSMERILNFSTKNEQQQIIRRYEEKFADQIGAGFVSSFASGRMAFYSLMKALDVGQGDEVILTGFTCSVMPNAVLKLGATPIYADVDPKTFGSSPCAIESLISKKTKLIVAQHSFGIPCDIDKIMTIAKREGIFVLEDCAISLSSSLHNVPVGNWGDAAIFSTDHSKPINTMIGGLLYTKDFHLYEKIQMLSEKAPQLSLDHQKNILKQLRFERIFCNPKNYPRGVIINQLVRVFFHVIGRSNLIFLEDNYGNPTLNSQESYPYPAALPPFLAYLGIIELDRWGVQMNRRIKMLELYLNEMGKNKVNIKIPYVYFDESRKIIPLRFVFTLDNRKQYLKKMSKYFDVNWIWFTQPVSNSVDNCGALNYVDGSCPNSEKLCEIIVNFPCNISFGSDFLLKQALEKLSDI